MKTKLYLFVLAACCLAHGASARFAIDWYSVDGGGGTSSGGDFVLSASVAELSAGTLNGGDFSFDGGFWAVDTTLVPFSPVLTVTPGTNNTIVVSWPSPSTGWSLQSTTNLSSPVWTDVTATPADDGVTKSLSFDASSGSLFLRLNH